MTTQDHTAAPRYAEWCALRSNGQWTNGVPDWAKDFSGRMNDLTAANAVIEELAALAQPQQPAGQHDPDRVAFEAWARREMPRLSLRYNERLDGYMATETQLAYIAFCSARGPAAHPSQQEDDVRDANRWRAFRERDRFENLDYTDFQDQFREDADRIVDAAMTAAQDAAQGGGNG